MSRFRFLFFFLLLSVHCQAQFSDLNIVDENGLTVGLEKNTSVWADYGFKNGIHVRVKHTAIVDDLERQNWRVLASYSTKMKVVQAIASPFVTSDWYTSFYNVGFFLKLRNLWRDDIIKIGVEYIPYYDKDLKFQNGWAVGAQMRIYKQIALFAEYGRKPDYRIAYEKMYFGSDITVKDLCVKPMIEIPSYDSGIRWTHSKIVVSMSYSF